MGGGLCLLLTGCSTQTASVPEAAPGVTLSGGVHGGNQAVSGAQVYLYAVSQSGYAGTATSLLNSPGYVTTGTDGSFGITGDYTCPAGAYVYLLALGGNPGLAAGTNNPDLAMMTGLGACSNLSSTQYIVINEVTTIATAYALAPFLSTETTVGTSSTNVTGLANAFALIPNMVNLTTGAALATTPAGNGIVPQATINSLANALVPCVNSTGVGTPCSTLMTAANVAASGTPVDTVQAAINIAQNPGVNVMAIYNQSTPNAAFQPVLTAAPNDFTIQLAYSGGLIQVQGLAFDAIGNLYATNSNGANMTEFSPTGTLLKTLTSQTMYRPQEVAIDLNGNIWTEGRANPTYGYGASLIEFSSNGTLLSGTLGYTGGGLNTPRGLAVDNRGNIWLSGSSEVSEFTSAGVPVSGSSGYTYGGFLAVSFAINFDSLGNAWVVSESSDGTSNALTKFTPVSAALNAQGIYGGTLTSVGSGTLTYPLGVALDASNNAWVANSNNAGAGGAGVASVTEYSNSGSELSPTSGYTSGGLSNPQTVVIDGLGNVFTAQSQVTEYTKVGVAVTSPTGYQTVNGNDCCLTAAIDGSGNLWTSGINYVYQWVGLAAPVVTPKVKGVVNGTLAARP